jgi:hypothetical protein
MAWMPHRPLIIMPERPPGPPSAGTTVSFEFIPNETLGIPSFPRTDFVTTAKSTCACGAPCPVREALTARQIDQAALAMAATRSHVVALKLARAFMRPSHATRCGNFAVNGPHSGVCARKSSCGAMAMSASVSASSAR